MAIQAHTFHIARSHYAKSPNMQRSVANCHFFFALWFISVICGISWVDIFFPHCHSTAITYTSICNIRVPVGPYLPGIVAH